MGLPWVRLDTAFPRNHKLLALLGGRDGHRAALAYICSLAYSGEQGTDGFIPREALPLIHGRPADAKRLVEVRLWVAEPGGWVINDWTDYQMSTEETQRRSKKARAAALDRWHGKTVRPDVEAARPPPDDASGNAPSMPDA